MQLRLCPVHTEQLNYRTKKKEHKRQRRRAKEERNNDRKQKRRKLNQDSEKDLVEGEELEEEQQATSIVNAAEDEQIWSKQLDLSKEQPSREQEFERYLEDLLL